MVFSLCFPLADCPIPGHDKWLYWKSARKCLFLAGKEADHDLAVMECAKQNDSYGDSILPEPRTEAEHRELIKHAGTTRFWLGVVKGADKEWHYESNKEKVCLPDCLYTFLFV